MKLHAYLSFPGTCGDALKLYKEVLGGEIGETHYYDDSPMESPETKGKIMHTSFAFGDGNVLMASDTMGFPVAEQGNITLSISVSDVSEAESIFTGLAEGGTVKMPLEKTFWAKKFGMLTDKFGISWMVNCE